MAGEYDPSDNRVVMKMSTMRRAGQYMWVATCKEDGHKETGASENEAALDFARHVSQAHPGRQIRRQ